MRRKINFVLFILLVTFQACKKSEDLSNSLLSPEETLLTKYMKVHNAKEGTVSISSNSKNFKNEVSYR